MIRKKKRKETSIVLSQAPEVVISRKFELWCFHYFNKSNKECFGNATRSALKVYNTKDYATAGSIGYQNLKKLQMTKLAYLDIKGFGFADRMDISLSKALAGDYDAWHKFMVVVGEFIEGPTTLVQNNYDFSGFKEGMNKSRAERGLQPI